MPLDYNPDVPIETFDFIVTDECHRSIYGLWRQVLEYFDASIIGLTATPSKHTLGFFNQNLVAEYPYERSVADGVNVGYEVYRIRTRITEQGGRVETDETVFQVPVRDKRTRKVRYETLDADFEYTARELDRSVVNPNQIRTVLQTYKDRVFTELFPDRSGEWLPKTLIFAKDDHHAEEIVHAVREVFGEGNTFAKKITYRNTGDDPKTLIKAFRVEPFPRVAVTVDMIATGTDIKPVEVLIFMRDVKSEGYYEQMKGRGVRTIPDADLQAVTPDARTKTRFVLIDAVGVSETKKNASQPLERKHSISFDTLIEQIAMGRRDEDALSSLAARLAILNHKLDDEDSARITEITGGKNLTDLSNDLLDAIDADKQQAAIAARFGAAATPEQERAVIEELMEIACRPFNKAATRTLLKETKRKTDIVIDEITTDEIVGAGFDLKHAENTITSFKTFIEQNRDELTALQILYNQPYGQQRLTYATIRELVQHLSDPPHYLTTANVWQAYKRLDAARVRGAPVDEQLTEVVSLVRFALGQKLLGRPQSEPALFLEIMTKLPWSCLVCLVGPGQEINRGEGGLSLWGAALSEAAAKGVMWDVHASPMALRQNDGLVGLGILDGLANVPFTVVEERHLHLAVGLRAYRNAQHGRWVEAILGSDLDGAATIARSLPAPPARITRDLADLRSWLSPKRRGGRRVGLLASSAAARLVAEGIPPSPRSDELDAVTHWFLKPAGDFRSSNALEVPLSEFVCQGLEIDYAGLCWGGDLIWDDGQWTPRTMRAPNWAKVTNADRKVFRLNAYRVLLTRARAGLAIFVPRGDRDDPTRKPDKFDGVFNALVKAGCEPI